MFYLYPSIIARRLLLLAALSVLAFARACGPDFPNAYLTMPASDLARLPTLDFASELSRVKVEGSAAEPFCAVDEKAAANRERAEWREALLAGGMPPARVDKRLAAATREKPVPELPREFQLYAEGAREWHERNYGRALVLWREVLALPAAERHYRSVWATYMIGRVQCDTNDAAAREAFSQVRELAAQGFADSQGLAVASLGWEARIHLQQEQFPEALRLYLRQYALGDRSAATSLQMAIRAVFTLDDARATGESGSLWGSPLVALARDRDLRSAVTAWFTARGGPHAPWSAEAGRRFRNWIRALADTEALTPAEADRWAWAAYQNGLWEEAGKFAGVATADAPASEWVRAMLLLREGKVPEAAGHLAVAAQSFQQDAALGSPAFNDDGTRFESMHEDSPMVQLGAVRGVLALQRSQYIEALRLFRQAGRWADVAYVAEKVLTIDELTAFVRAETQPVSRGLVVQDRWEYQQDRTSSADFDLRWLLARRLVRAGKFDEAREYFPAETVNVYASYVAAVRKGYDRVVPKLERADALWFAAKLVEQHGMDWQGTELAPDYAITDGDHEWPEMARLSQANRRRSFDLENGDVEKYRVDAATLVSPDELSRAWKSGEPLRKYHYRHRATELAFLAATLLPDDDEHTATILNTAGRWIVSRYPQDAEIFYKTLVFRCPNTVLGRKAADQHWLVSLNSKTPAQ